MPGVPLVPGPRGAAPRHTAVRFAVQLGAPHSAYLRQHVVSGRAVCPAAALLESAAAGVRAALGGIGMGPCAALVDVSIPSPLLLGPAMGNGVGAGEVTCTVDLAGELP